MGSTSSGLTDPVVVKLDGSGALLWARQLGTSLAEGGNAVAADGSGRFYVAGSTFGSFPDFTNAGAADVFVAKYDPDGNRF